MTDKFERGELRIVSASPDAGKSALQEWLDSLKGGEYVNPPWPTEEGMTLLQSVAQREVTPSD